MLRNISLSILLTILSLQLIAQTTVKGRIMQNKTSPVAFCNLLVLDAADSSFLKGEIIENGYFDFKVAHKEFILKIDVMGFKEEFITVQESTDFGQIFLTEENLSTIEIRATKLPFEIRNGNTVINVANNIFQSSTSTQEILNKSPGVIISNGEVSVIGSGNAIIYLDQKQISYAAMQAIPVSQIESIEIIKNPDASFDAEGKAIILIVLKDLGLEGIQGTITGHYTKGFYQLGFIDININAKKGKWSLNTSANTNFGATGTQRTDYFDVKTGSPYTANTTYQEKVYLPNVYNYLFGVNYQINSKHAVSAQYNGNYSKYDLEVDNSIDQTTESSMVNIITKDTALSIEQTNVLSANYSFSLDSLGSKFFAGLTYSSVLVSYMDAVQEITHLNSESTVLNSLSQGENINGIGIFQMDYQKNFKNQNQLKIGIKAANTLSNSTVFLETIGANTLVNSRNDLFQYEEQILSGYTNWNGQWKMGDYQVGLRMENTTSEAIKNQSNQAYIDTSYLSFFPNAGFTTKFKKWSMSDQFTSKISRPRYSDITPYIYYINAFSSIYGNPHVKPSFVYNFEHKFTYKKTSLGIGYNHTKSPRTFINLQDQTAESINVLKVVNVDKLERFYAELRKSTTVSSLFNFTMLNLSYSVYKSKIYDFGDLQSTPQLYAYTYNRLGVKNWFDIELIGEFTSGFSNGKRSLRAQGEIDLGISKTFANGKCFAQITVNDIFQTAKPSPYAFVNNNYYSSSTTQDTRFLRISFSYQFGKLKTPDYDHLNIDTDEIQRAK